MNPYVPLIFRLIVLITSIIALSIAGSVHHLSNKYSYSQSPSTTMAIVVDVIAIPYTLYMTWDEYTGKPLGLRAPKAKIRLVLLDLFFIILEASNLTLAFDAISDDNGSCKVGNTGYNGVVCHRAKTLCAIITIALLAWGMTFAVSIFRYVLSSEVYIFSSLLIFYQACRKGGWPRRGRMSTYYLCLSRQYFFFSKYGPSDGKALGIYQLG